MVFDLQMAIKGLTLAFVESTTLGVGLLFSPHALIEPIRDIRQMAAALFACFVLVPGIAVAIAACLHLDPAIGAALLLLATVPGGSALIKFTAVAKGDQALAVSLIVVLMLGSILYQPIVLPLLIHGVAVNPASIVGTLLFTVLLPLAVGLTLRARRPGLAERLQPWMRRSSNVATVLLLILLPVSYFSALKDFAGTGGISAAILFVVAAIAVGWSMGGRQLAGRRIQAMCCAQGNFAVAFVVATRNFPDPRVSIMLLVLLLAAIAILTPLALAFANSGSGDRTAWKAARDSETRHQGKQR